MGAIKPPKDGKRPGEEHRGMGEGSGKEHRGSEAQGRKEQLHPDVIPAGQLERGVEWDGSRDSHNPH